MSKLYHELINRHHPLPVPSNLQNQLIKFLDEVTADVCAATTDNTIYELIDRRETGNSSTNYYAYQVRKIGTRCWMVQNLALPGGTTYVGTYSNFPSGGSTFTLPGSSTSGWTDNSAKYVYNGTHIGKGSIDNEGNGTITTKPQKDNTTTNLGAYYSFNAAAAINTKIGTTDEDNDQTAKNYNTLYSICPRNWKLPSFVDTNGASIPGGDFGALTNGYLKAFDVNYSAALTGSASFSLFQNAYTSSCNRFGCIYTVNLNTNSFWWSSTVSSLTAAYLFWANSSNGLAATNDGRRDGVSIRCVVGGCGGSVAPP